MAALALIVALLVAASAAQEAPTNINCDGDTSAADISAAILVSADPVQFPDCAAAGAFRGQPISDADLLPIIQDVFNFFDVAWTPTPSRTPTATRTRTNTRTATVTRTATATGTVTATRTVTATGTETGTPSPSPSRTQRLTATATVTGTATRTRTRTPTPPATPTPTGLAYQLSGEWAADWRNQPCYLNGEFFARLDDTTYRVTALDGLLDITAADGGRIGRGLAVDAQGNVEAQFRKQIGEMCEASGRLEEFLFDYKFMFRTNGTGAASVKWSYGKDSLCAVCEVDDTATLHRLSGPGVP